MNTNKEQAISPERQVAELVRPRWEAINLLDESTLPEYEPECILCRYSAKRAAFKIKEAQCIFGGGRLERYECPSCGCIFGPKKILELPPDVLAQDYKDLYSIYSESDSSKNEIRAFHMLSPKKNGIYLNYGSGAWSKSAAILQSEGYKVYTYDSFCDGGHPDMLTLEQVKLKKFDGIYSNNVIEHFIDPVVEFQFLRSLLKRGAAMSHASPCYEYLYEYTRFHTILFTGKSLKRLASAARMRLGKKTRDGEFICQIFRRPWW